MVLSENYEEAILWIFKNTDCKLIMTCLIGYDQNGTEIYQYLKRESNGIHHLTGEEIYFIYPVEGDIISNAAEPIRLNDLRAKAFRNISDCEGHILTSRIYDAINDECPRLVDFQRCDLPGLVFILKGMHYAPIFVPITSENKIDEIKIYFKTFDIVHNFLIDYNNKVNQFRKFRYIKTKEELEAELLMVEEEKSKRMEGFDCSIDFSIEKISNILTSHNVSEADIDALKNHPNLKLYLRVLFHKYPILQQSQQLHAICRNIRKSQQVAKLDELIEDKKRNIQTAIPKAHILELEEKTQKLLRKYEHELSKQLLSDEDAQYVIEKLKDKRSLVDAYNKIISIIKERSLKILTAIKSIEWELTKYGFDVFISCKSVDYSAAHELYHFLKENGYRPFIADFSLREVGSDRYGEVIRAVIDRCKHLIVFATNPDYIETPYVSHEWNLFYDEYMAGRKIYEVEDEKGERKRKNGKLLAVIPSLSAVPNLPIAFRNTQCFEIGTFRDSILDFLEGEDCEQSKA